MLRIKDLCKKNGMSLKELAGKLGISQGALSQNIDGRVGLPRLQEIAKILGVQVKDLFEDENVTGFVKAGGIVHEISSYSDLEKILKLKE